MKTVGQVHVALVLLVSAAACQPARAGDRQQPLPSAPSKRFEHDMMVRYHMHENFGLLRSIELLLVHGKLDDAKAFARMVADAPDEPGLEPFAKRAAAVRERAASLADAPGIDEACRREARLAAACADCHADAGVLPEFAKPPSIPPDLDTVKARMARHLWATDRLWEGVVGQSDESWRAGLDVLAAAPLPWSVMDAGRDALARGLQQAADAARTAPASDRPRRYGEILVVCAACHAASKK
jgi:cytochrome c553